jgi:hypothetical protein
MTTQVQVQAIIDAAMSRATTMTEAAQGYSQDAMEAIDDASFELTNPPITGGSATRPYYTGGSVDDPSSSFTSEFDAKAAELVEKLADIFGDFLNTYFPTYSAAATAAESWLLDVIQNGTTGIPADVENQIWERSRARELVEASRLEAEAAEDFARRGFSMPPGALADRVDRIRQDTANKISTHGRDVAIKQAEIAIETVRFAIGEALKLRWQAIQSALEYWKAYLSPYDVAAKRALAEGELKTKFYDKSLELFRIEAGIYGHDIQQNAAFWDSQLKAYMAQATAISGLGRAKADAAMGAAKAAGDIAAAAQSALNTLSSYGYQETYNSQ